jgi:hypothetical protein
MRVIEEAMTNYKAQMSNKVQSSNQAPRTPLKIRGVRGVMRIMAVTPFNPPYFKGEI